MTTETQLVINALKRDLERYRNSDNLVERERIKRRMVDTVNGTVDDHTLHEQVMEIIEIVTQLY